MTDQPATPGNYCKIPGCTEPFAYDHRCERHTDDDPCACGSTLVICSCGDERCLRCDPHGCRPFKPVTPTHAIRAHDAERQLTGYPGPSVYPPADSIQVRPKVLLTAVVKPRDGDGPDAELLLMDDGTVRWRVLYG